MTNKDVLQIYKQIKAINDGFFLFVHTYIYVLMTLSWI